MHLIKQTRLHFKQGKSDKVYEVDLVEVSADQFLVNFRYGRRGNKLREGSKTIRPVSQAEAVKIFDSVVVSKMNGGYLDSATSSAPAAGETTSVVVSRHGHHPNQALIKRYLTDLAQEEESSRRSRMIWRLAELNAQESIDTLLAGRRGDWLEDYCIAWALGRLQAHSHRAVLETMTQSEHLQVRNMAFEALLLLSDVDQQQALLAVQANLIPSDLLEKCNLGSEAEIRQAVHSITSDDRKNHNALLITLYQFSHTRTHLRAALLHYLKHVPFKPNYFQAVRNILKVAEMRMDAQVFGILNVRFEKEKPYCTTAEGYSYRGVHYTLVNGCSYDRSELFEGDNPKVAFSNRTRLYLRKRAWRTLKHMGSASDQRYTDFAYELLLNVTDDDRQAERTSEQYHYDYNSRRGTTVHHRYGAFASFIALNHIIYGQSQAHRPARGGHVWLKKAQEDAADARTESFPQLWDQAPDKLLSLLCLSQCEAVHNFACNALQNATEFNKSIRPETLATLLVSEYPCTAAFALKLVEQRLSEVEKFTIEIAELIEPLLSSPLVAARELGLRCLQQIPARELNTAAASALVGGCLLVPYHETQLALQEIFAPLNFSLSIQQSLLQFLITAVDEKERQVPSFFQVEHLQFVGTFIEQKMQSAAQKYDLDIITGLIAKPGQACQYLAAQLLLLSAVSFDRIPQALLQALNRSEYASVRSMGVKLLGKQSVRELAKQIPVLIDICLAADKLERAAYFELFSRLATDKDCAAAICHQLVELSFKRLNSDDQAEEIERFFAAHLTPASAGIDDNKLWRMLQSKAKLAQALAARSIVSRPARNYSVKQWAILGKNANKIVRDYAHQAYRQNIELVCDQRSHALALLETDWQDSREFACDFFREHFNADHWDSDAIILLCDSVRDDIQAFGREILLRYFDNNLGHVYLQKLSQHPSVNVQLFTSSLLSQYAAGEPQRIVQLEPYFMSVFAQVYRGRVCKDRVTEFLLQQAQLSEDVAVFCARMFTQISLTIVQKDKSQLLKAMLKLKRLYPQIDLPIELVKPTVKASA